MTSPISKSENIFVELCEQVGLVFEGAYNPAEKTEKYPKEMSRCGSHPEVTQPGAGVSREEAQAAGSCLQGRK